MLRSFLLTLVSLVSLSFMLSAQESSLTDLGPSQKDALDNIENALSEIEANLKGDDQESRALIKKIRESTAALKKRLPSENPKELILFEIKLIDLDAEGAKAACNQRFGSISEGITEIPTETAQKLKGFPGLLSAPQILVNSGQRAELTLGQEQEYSYLRRRARDVFVVDKTRLRDGLELHLQSTIENGGNHFTKLNVDISRIVGKTELSPDCQTVGMPLFSRQTGSCEYRSAFGMTQAFRVHGDEGEGIMVLIHATLAASK